ncbi:unnamed protein product [Eruca vesicaria subsp. sativa]|uniref:Cyclic nucleotide-binding domain-containing protein n=1 Tax=Eruca vesicaria subsp. sativa TaxID=29727 RepID=A0ABC8KZB3_ERUVS|nr:unnamed protein product [Eruca vesicaria subsp. sativa]
MASSNENDDVPMLPVSDTSSSRTRSRSISLANTSSTIDVFENSSVGLGYTDPLGTQRRPPPSTGGSSDFIGASSSQPELVSKHEHLLISGKLGMCNDPYCTSCPPDYKLKAAKISTSGSTPRNALDDDANKGWFRRFATSIDKCLPLPKIMEPHSKTVQSRNKFFAYTCLFSIFVDPFFFYPIEVNEEDRCIKINWLLANIIVAIRFLADALYCINILFQFRMAYVAPESTVVGAGQLVYDPIKVAGRYLLGKFKQDISIVIPIPQILMLWVIPHVLGISGANDIKNLLRTAILIQCPIKLHRLIHLLAGQRPTGFMFKSARANFFINLCTYMLAGHVVGSCWYLFGLQRVNQCLRDACDYSDSACKQLIDCGRDHEAEVLDAWKGNVSASACFEEGGFQYGVYWKAVNLTHDPNVLTRYTYSLFWGLQNFLQSLGRRNMEMTLRQRDVDQWMRHRLFPERIKMRVQESEWFHWTASGGINEELLLENMTDDIQRDIKRHLFAFLNKVRIFSKMDEPFLDAIRERLKQRTYLKSSMVLDRNGLVNKMVFIVRGKMESIGEEGSRTPLLEGDVCGEELLTWCKERSSDGTSCDDMGPISNQFTSDPRKAQDERVSTKE